ncbi:MAG: putative O-glycosylation ligase, exosortase A system-associated [Pseudomonadota bacterium]
MFSSIFIVIAMGVMLPAILMAPHTSIFIWSWFSYMNPHRNTWSFAKTLPLLDAVAAFTMVAWLTSKERKLPPAHPIVAVLLFFFLWTLVTTVFATNQDLAWDRLLIFFKIILFTFFTMIFITTPQRLRYLIYIIIVCLALYSLRGGIFTILNGGKYIVFGPSKSFLSDNNQLALAFITVVPLCFWAYKHGEHFIVRMLGGSIGALTLISVLGSHSRGALVALVGMGAWMIIIGRRWVAGPLLALAVLGGATILMPESWFERMNTIDEFEEDESANTRLRMWKYTLNATNASPVLGHGFVYIFNKTLAGKYMPGGGKIFVAHSNYFDTLGEHGYVGLFLYLLLFSCAFVTTSEIRKLTKKVEGYEWALDLAQMLQFSLVGFALGGAFLSLSIFDLYYHVVAMVMMLHYMVAKELAPEQKHVVLNQFKLRSGSTAVPAE